MKLSVPSIRRGQTRSRGITLIECLVYIGAVGLVFGLGTTAFYRCIDNTAALRRNSDDITQVLSIGELWRADIRAATQPVRFDAADQTLRIPHEKTDVTYQFSENRILRRASSATPWVIVLPQVKQSQMTPDPHPHVMAWRWEIELRSRRQPALIRPLFTFTAATSQP